MIAARIGAVSGRIGAMEGGGNPYGGAGWDFPAGHGGGGWSWGAIIGSVGCSGRSSRRRMGPGGRWV